ncbi:MAG TPA: AI-2E family transporter [Candidatus Krumholzibacteria bacterium]|nr:AI-2E family transporter [Candidatus Krumholzibacteria bacterium]
MTNAETYRRNFLTLLLVVVTVGFLLMMRRFLIPLLLAAIFAALVSPLYRRLLAGFRGRRTLASVTTLCIVLLLVVIPLTLFAGILAKEAIHISGTAGPWIQYQVNNPDELIRKLQALPFADRVVPYQEQILQRVAEIVRAVGGFFVDRLSDATRGTVAFILDVVIMFYAMFFFLTDGGRFLDGIMGSIPLSPAERNRIQDRFVSVTRAALSSTVVIGIIQGTLGGIAFAVAGVPGAVFWGTVMAVFAMVPGIGPAVVWAPVCGYLFATGHNGAGIGLVLFCALGVGSVDNLLRPRLVGKGTQLPDLLVMLATLGGLMMFGAVGFILGPVIAALFVTTWDIFNTFVRESRETAGGV